MTKPKSKKTRKILIFGGILLLLAGLGAAAIFWKREVVTTVQTEKVGRRNITELVVANGRIQPVVQVVINPEVSGEIIELPVKEGQPVKKGDLLLRIKPDNYQAARNSAEASYNSSLASRALAQANLNKAELEYRRAQKLFDEKLVSDSQFLEAKTELDVRKASFQTSEHMGLQAKATLAKADDDLAKTTIYSPTDGTVTKLKSQLGERVVGTALMAGTEIMTIANLEEMEARVDISEVDVVLIALGQRAALEVDAFGERKFEGRVTEIANSSKGSNQFTSSQQQEATKFEVKIRIQDKEGFRPGMSVTAEIETRSRTNVLAVPIQCVTARVEDKPGAKNTAKNENSSGGGTNSVVSASSSSPTNTAAGTNLAVGSKLLAKKGAEANKPPEVVFVVEGERVKMLKVKRGISDDAYVEITDGLKEGVDVVSGGYKAINRDLKDGNKVRRGTAEEEKSKDKDKDNKDSRA